MQAIKVTNHTVTTAVGSGLQAHRDALIQGRSALTKCDFPDCSVDTYIGKVAGLEELSWPAEFAKYDCRNNRLAYHALQQDDFLKQVEQAKARYSLDRIAIIMGTTTSGTGAGEAAYKQLDPNGKLPADFNYLTTANHAALADFVNAVIKIKGPCYTIGTACSSSALVFSSAQRLLANEICDCVIVGGVDSLCLTTLYGFTTLELTSKSPCQPCDADRCGLSIGDGAGFALLERATSDDTGAFGILGYGESGDAHHISSPHPEGKGAINAMQAALNMSGKSTADIDYINMHGTASKVNDQVEDLAIYNVFGKQVPASSTKGMTGHTLGAAGIVEVGLSLLCIQENIIPGCLNTQTLDPGFKSQIRLATQQGSVNTVLSNSFGFAGNNCALVLGRIA